MAAAMVTWARNQGWFFMASPGYVMSDIKRTLKAKEWRGQSRGRLQGNSPFAMHYAML